MRTPRFGSPAMPDGLAGAVGISIEGPAFHYRYSRDHEQ
jgi:hypothetical protein